MLYDPMDVLLLSRLGGFEDTAHFAAAQRLAWPLLITLSAVSGTLYPVASAAWPHNVPRLERACQRGFETVVVFGLAAVSGGIAGAEFLLALIGPELVAGAPAFGVLLVLCVVKSISMTLGPVLLVVRAQRLALAIVGIALVAKVVASLLVIPRYGFIGLAWTALAVETFFVALPALVVVSRRAGIRLRYGVVLRAALIFAIATLVTQAWLGPHGLWPALMAPALYFALALATGTLRPSELKRLKQPEEAG
jgi:O-antigen/teichoic acid export membrane protein